MVTSWSLFCFCFLSQPPSIFSADSFPPSQLGPQHPSRAGSCCTWLNPSHSAWALGPLSRVTATCTCFPHSGSRSTHVHRPPQLPDLWYTKPRSLSVEVFPTMSENALHQPHMDALLYCPRCDVTSVPFMDMCGFWFSCISDALFGHIDSSLSPCECLLCLGPPNDRGIKLFRKGKGNK